MRGGWRVSSSSDTKPIGRGESRSSGSLTVLWSDRLMKRAAPLLLFGAGQFWPRRLRAPRVRRPHVARARAAGGGGRDAARRADRRPGRLRRRRAGRRVDARDRLRDGAAGDLRRAARCGQCCRWCCPPRTVFVLLISIFALVGAPFIARGVRAIVRSEARLEYASAARALGASDARVLLRHLLPATRGFVAVEMTMLVPAFIVAEATLSYVGLGFPDPWPAGAPCCTTRRTSRCSPIFPG